MYWLLLAYAFAQPPGEPPMLSGRFESEHDCWMAQQLSSKYRNDALYICTWGDPIQLGLPNSPPPLERIPEGK